VKSGINWIPSDPQKLMVNRTASGSATNAAMTANNGKA
jgi:hypothetical protein